MKIFTYTVLPNIPESLEPLREIMSNLWWTWNPVAVDLFRRIDHDVWSQTGHNPVAMLSRVSQDRLYELSKDPVFLAHLDRTDEALKSYLEEATWMSSNFPQWEGHSIAYFSMEYALHECLPIYAGGLGILAGDHIKSASELGVPLVAVGLLYREGHYHQYLSHDGWQKEVYQQNDFYNLPITPVLNELGKPVRVAVKIQDREVTLQAWRAKVGRVQLILLDADLQENTADMRAITNRLYAPGNAMRLSQEIVLGIGGVRMLEQCEIHPTILHMNEGHSAFLAIERIRMLMRDEELSFEEALCAIRSSTLFTTHTPVAAGIDRFGEELLKSHLSGELKDETIPLDKLLSLGRRDPKNSSQPLSMAVLAIRTSARRNGVSELHGRIAREMWAELWPQIPTDEIPIDHITNGIHVRTWLSDEMARLLDRYLGPDWISDPLNKKVWERIFDIPDNELWRAQERLKQRLIGHVRRVLPRNLERRQSTAHEIYLGEQILDFEALTIGFARRFATYKRANLIFHDMERLTKILNDKDRPVQIVFAGKAHPADDEGKNYIKEIILEARKSELRDKIAFIEDYDMNVARYLVQGVDVWLNTPLRPFEACGTSGMKVIPNGGLHLSILDGWWDEAYSKKVGWAIGGRETLEDREIQNQMDSNALYDLLEQEIVPMFYDRVEEDLPQRWVQKMKTSIAHLVPQFNTNRMVRDYVSKQYTPLLSSWKRFSGHNFLPARNFTKWEQMLRAAWPGIRFMSVDEPKKSEVRIREGIEVQCVVDLNGMKPDDIVVELYSGSLITYESIEKPKVGVMTWKMKTPEGKDTFSGYLHGETSGKHGYAIRILPKHTLLENPSDLEMVLWV